MTVDPNIQQKADYIRTKKKGSEVRESLASGLEAMSEDVVENKSRQNTVEDQFQQVIDETTGKDVISAPEIIAARNGEPNLKSRLDKEKQEVNQQLAQIVINVKTFGAVGDGITDDTEAFENARTFLEGVKGGTLYAPLGSYVCKSNVLNLRDSIRLKGDTKPRSTQTNGTQILFYKDENETGVTYGVQMQYNNIGQAIEDIRLIGDDTIQFGVHQASGTFNNTMRNVDIEKFEVGLQMTQTWNNIYEKVTTRLCEVGFKLNRAMTSSVFNGCLAYDADIGFSFDTDCVVMYSTFNGCGTDHSHIGVQVRGNIYNTNFNNFGFEDFYTAYDIDSDEAFLNIHGFSNYIVRTAGRMFNIGNIKRLNLYGCDFEKNDSGATLFLLRGSGNWKGKLYAYGCLFTQGGQSSIRTAGLEHFIIDGQPPLNYLIKRNNRIAKQYEGVLIWGNEFLFRHTVPTNGDKVVMYLDIAGETTGGRVTITTTNTDGQYTTDFSDSIEGVTMSGTFVQNPTGRAITVRSTERLIIQVKAITIGNTANIEPTLTVNVIDG